jgi:TRAP transporter 4TM/12TM fusion protein
LPNVFSVLARHGIFVLPIFLVVILMIQGYTVMWAGFVAIAVSLVLLLILVPDRVQMLRKLLKALESSPMLMVAVAAAVLNAGIIIGVLTMTGLGLRLSSLIVDASMGYLPLGLVFSMLLATFLGMGMPTSGAYIIMGTLVAPGLMNMGLSVLQSHMFVFYFACMSMITPPVAIAAYAAAGLAGADANQVGFAAWKLGLAAFIVPFMFAYGPALLMVGSLAEVVFAFITASLGCVCLACAVEGRLLIDTKTWERIALLVGALLLIETGRLTDVIGAVIGAVVLFSQHMRRRSSAPSNLRSS